MHISHINVKEVQEAAATTHHPHGYVHAMLLLMLIRGITEVCHK